MTTEEELRQVASERDALARALYDVLYELHPVYPSTSGPHGGIGGAAMTPWCHVKDPYDEKHQRLVDAVDQTLRESFRLAEREGRDLLQRDPPR